MTIDRLIAIKQPAQIQAAPAHDLTEALEQHNQRFKTRSGLSDGTHLLDPVYVPGLITPVQTEGVLGGVNHHVAHANASGLLVLIQHYANMRDGDWINVFWGNDSSPVASSLVFPEHVGENVPMFIAASRIPAGVNSLFCTVSRDSGGDLRKSTPIDILVRMEFPGGTDPEPDLPGHRNLLSPKLALPPSGIIDDEAAQSGVEVTIDAYPNIRQYDKITLNWGAEFVTYEVTEADVGRGAATILVPREVILNAGDSDELVLVYWVVDEVHNQSSDWSLRAYVAVEVGSGLFDGPLIANPDYEATPYDVIDLDALGDEDLYIDVMVVRSGSLRVGDVVTLLWVGTTTQGQDFTVEPAPQTVNRSPAVLTFAIPNADVRELSRGRGVASYTVSRIGQEDQTSKRAFVTFLGVEMRLPAPTVTEAEGGVLDPALTLTTVVVSGTALEAGDAVVLTWLGTRSNGSPLLHTEQRGVSGGTAGKPMSFIIDGETCIKPLNGGHVSVYYSLFKLSGDQTLESERSQLRVGESRFELPAPSTRPFAQNGILDPDELPEQLLVVVPPYPNMAAWQTVHMIWEASTGPNYTDYMPITSHMLGKEVIFSMDRGEVEGNLGAHVRVSYRVESDSEPTRPSACAEFTIGEPQGSLPLPVVVEALDGALDPVDATRGVTVRIPADADLAFGDDVEVYWNGREPDGVTTVSRLVQEDHIGQPFDLMIDYPYVIANASGKVVVHYEVFQRRGTIKVSAPITLSVQGAVLPLPAIDEAVADTLNPYDVQQGATVRIDASARLRSGDAVKVSVVSTASGGSIDLTCTVPADGTGQPLTVTVSYDVVKASSGVGFDLSYEITRAAGGPVEQSDTRTYSVSREIGSGPILVMGARFTTCTYRASSSPGTLSAFHLDSRLPMPVEWRYEGSSQWLLRTHWFDDQPWMKLYVRNANDAVGLNPANVIGNGWNTSAAGTAAFVAIRDEVSVGAETHVDMVAWGNPDCGGKLDSNVMDIKDVVEVSATGCAYAARRRNGQVVCWGNPAEGGSLAPEEAGDFVQVRAGWHVFVGLKNDGRLVGWGIAKLGASIPVAVSQHRDYVELCGGGGAFAARRATGQIVAWGEPDLGGVLGAGQDSLSDIIQLSASHAAFVALREAGGARSVIGWGHEGYGGHVPPEIAALANVRALGAATLSAFAILLATGEVRGWGDAAYGGQVPTLIQSLTTVMEVSSTWYAFCARLSNGHVVAWGNSDAGGRVPEAIARLSGIVQVAGSARSFAALCRDGTVVAWGDPEFGGSTALVAAELVNVRAVYANSNGFTALTSEGHVVTWGALLGGGDSSEVQEELRNKVTTGHTETLKSVAVGVSTDLRGAGPV
ncbi:RCC1 domain-containing protein [Pseudomonas sp. Marseille-P9899]|uniref:RCC1 domain-containing protein n=1 Tax=Pseudomonas sp. Marseille-P9899 TaxID=2730401 RepID=UPI0015893787|nr:hypothetical protein [Pseudomonas sp. Marseille-P9899]